MSRIKTKKINDVKVEKIEFDTNKDERPVLGSDLFDELSCNIFFCAKKFSGKTVATGSVIKKCASKDTKITVFCASINSDDTWLGIRKYCDDKGIPFEGHTSIFDEDGDNLVEILVRQWREIIKNEDDRMGEDGEDEEGDNRMGDEKQWIRSSSGERIIDNRLVAQVKKKKPKKSKYRSPKNIIIFDDVSIELSNKWITALVKIHRHFDSKIIFSSQDIVDISKGARNQMNYVLIFKGMPVERIERVWKNCALPITFSQLMEMYTAATEKPYSFLYIDAPHNKYRINFSDEIEIPPPQENENLKKRRLNINRNTQ